VHPDLEPVELLGVTCEGIQLAVAEGDIHDLLISASANPFAF
jgi:hypothetical protein